MAEARRVPELAETLRFDLANALSSDAVDASNFFQRAAVAINETKAQFENLPFTFGETCQNVVKLLFEQTVADPIGRVLRCLVFNEISGAPIFVLADGRVERDRLLAHL